MSVNRAKKISSIRASHANERVTTPPTGYPISVDELKEHLRLTGDAEDNYLESIIAAATDIAEQYTGRKFLTTGITAFYDLPCGGENGGGVWDGVRVGPVSSVLNSEAVELPWPPLQSVTSVSAFDDDDIEEAVDPSVYYVDATDLDVWGRVIVKEGQSWPSNMRAYNSLKVVYDAGYGDDPNDVPASIRRSLLILGAFLYENRGDCGSPGECVMKAGCAGGLEQNRIEQIGVA